MEAVARSIRASRAFNLRIGTTLRFRLSGPVWTAPRLRRHRSLRGEDMRCMSSSSDGPSPCPSPGSSSTASPPGPLSRSSLSLSMLHEDEEYYKRFGYTWLTHMRLAEEDSVFRQHIADVRRRRRRYGSYGSYGTAEGDESENAVKGNDDHSCSGNDWGGVIRSETSSSDDSDDELVLEGASSKPTWLQSSLESSFSQDSPDYTSELEWLSSQNEVIYNNKDADASRPENAIAPLWISVHIDEDSKTASLYESVVPVGPNVIRKLEMKHTWRPFYVLRLEEEEADRNRFQAYSVEPLARVPRLTFEEYPEYTSGPWRNYFVGIWGEVAAVDEGTLWPNRVLHKDRCVYNVRNGLDLVRFLADPRKQDIEAHARNLERLANGGIDFEQPAVLSEETVSSSWVWGLLKSRWGSHGLQKHGFL